MIGEKTKVENDQLGHLLKSPILVVQKGDATKNGVIRCSLATSYHYRQRHLKFSVTDKRSMVLVNNLANSFAFHHFYNCNGLQDSIRSANNLVNAFSAILVFAGMSLVKFRFRPEFRLGIEIRFLLEPD